MAALAYHGALWLHWRTDLEIRQRLTKVIPFIFVLLLVLWSATIAASISVQPLLTENFQSRRWGIVFPIGSFLAIFASLSLHRRKMAGAAFLTSALSLYGDDMRCCRWALSLRSSGKQPANGSHHFPGCFIARVDGTGIVLVDSGNDPVILYTYFVYSRFIGTNLSLFHEEH